MLKCEHCTSQYATQEGLDAHCRRRHSARHSNDPVKYLDYVICNMQSLSPQQVLAALEDIRSLIKGESTNVGVLAKASRFDAIAQLVRDTA